MPVWLCVRAQTAGGVSVRGNGHSCACVGTVTGMCHPEAINRPSRLPLAAVRPCSS